ncbi:MAG: hypothetical protein VKJ64_16920 [Leptolyngbyaceae bacterium]|nr:hypothetical protein [Leptolyngbyaceae bacterium]
MRPISNLDGGSIPLDFQYIRTEYISLLDIVNIPFDYDRKSGHEVENIGYKSLPWVITGKADLAHLLCYCEHSLLYPQYGKAIPYHYLEWRSPVRTLQLIEVTSLSCYKDDRNKWKGIIADKKYNLAHFQLSITDPIILDRLERGICISSHCLICLSLSQPWQQDSASEWLCYRLIAGVIELLPELQMILAEMTRVSWNMTRGKQYLQDNFGKQSRYQLTASEAQQFLNYLQQLNITDVYP